MPKSRFAILVRTPLALAVILLAGTAVFSKRGLGDWRRMVEKTGELEVKIARLENQISDLERQTKTLQSDPVAQERVIRQMMGYVKPDEVVVAFTDPATPLAIADAE